MNFVSFNIQIISTGIAILFLLQIVQSAVLEQIFNRALNCEAKCESIFCESSLDLRESCQKGCRLFTVFDLAKLSHKNSTVGLCQSVCSEEFKNETIKGACNYGCQEAVSSQPSKDDSQPQTLHLLTPLVYLKSAYNTMAHHMRQFISTSWTVYIQEDSGKMVVLQTNPKMIESPDYANPKDSSFKKYQQNWREERLDWMDCISHQSGLPRWLLVVVLSGFIMALLWLCCVMAVTAPNQYLTSSQKKNVGYVLLCEPNHNELKIPLEEEAPPLPSKPTII